MNIKVLLISKPIYFRQKWCSIKNSILIFSIQYFKCEMKKFGVVLLLFVLSACGKERGPLIGTWAFSGLTEDSSQTENMQAIDKEIFSSYITFSSDKTFLFLDYGTEDFINLTASLFDSPKPENGRIYSGTWSQIDSVIYFDIDNYPLKDRFYAEIVSLDRHHTVLKFPNQQHTEFESSVMAFTYKKTYYEDISNSEFDFTRENLNNWRIKSSRKESEKELRTRIINSLDFAIHYFEYHEKQKLKSANKQYVQPLPFRFYENGIVLERLRDCPEWIELFYDHEDAIAAQKIIRSGFRRVGKVPEDLKHSPFEIYLYVLKNVREILDQ